MSSSLLSRLPPDLLDSLLLQTIPPCSACSFSSFSSSSFSSSSSFPYCRHLTSHDYAWFVTQLGRTCRALRERVLSLLRPSSAAKFIFVDPLPAKCPLNFNFFGALLEVPIQTDMERPKDANYAYYYSCHDLSLPTKQEENKLYVHSRWAHPLAKRCSLEYLQFVYSNECVPTFGPHGSTLKHETGPWQRSLMHVEKRTVIMDGERCLCYCTGWHRLLSERERLAPELVLRRLPMRPLLPAHMEDTEGTEVVPFPFSIEESEKSKQQRQAKLYDARDRAQIEKIISTILPTTPIFDFYCQNTRKTLLFDRLPTDMPRFLANLAALVIRDQTRLALACCFSRQVHLPAMWKLPRKQGRYEVAKKLRRFMWTKKQEEKEEE